MAGRIFWIGVAGAALVTGMVVQDGDEMFGWGHDNEVSTRIDRRIDRSVDRAVDRSVAKMQITDSDGREIDVPAESKQAFADAVGRLVKAEADYAVLRIRDGNRQERAAARARRDHARTEVETLKDAIESQEQGRDEVREQIRRNVRDNVRETVREAVRS